jgi:hypothetical protein
VSYLSYFIFYLFVGPLFSGEWAKEKVYIYCSGDRKEEATLVVIFEGVFYFFIMVREIL